MKTRMEILLGNGDSAGAKTQYAVSLSDFFPAPPAL
jgi:hypothetical protein